MKTICKGGMFETAKGTRFIVTHSGPNAIFVIRFDDAKGMSVKTADFKARVASGQYTIITRDGK